MDGGQYAMSVVIMSGAAAAENTNTNNSNNALPANDGQDNSACKMLDDRHRPDSNENQP